jgi:ferritin-like metal-binding protein YciE
LLRFRQSSRDAGTKQVTRGSVALNAGGSPLGVPGAHYMAIQTLNDLFLHTLRDIYYAENKISQSLPKMSAKATSPDLKAAFDEHLVETQEHVERLTEVFEMIGEEPSGERCPAIEGIIEEAEELAAEIEDAEVLDAALIAAAQAVEHYEITRYGTLISWAEELGLDDAAAILHQTLEEEYAADTKLSELGESGINAEADEGEAS